MQQITENVAYTGYPGHNYIISGTPSHKCIIQDMSAEEGADGTVKPRTFETEATDSSTLGVDDSEKPAQAKRRE